MVTQDSTTAVAERPAVTSYGTAAAARSRRAAVVRPLARRFYTVREAAERLSIPISTINADIYARRLPILALPSTHADAARRNLVVPAPWLTGARWLDMAPGGPLVLTSRAALAQPTDPIAVGVDVAAVALALGRTNAYELIRAGLFCPVRSDTRGKILITTADLDAWAARLMNAVELEWYAVATGQAVTP